MPDATGVLLAWQRHAAASYGFASRAGRRMRLGLAEVAALEQVQTHGPMTPGEIGASLAMPSGSVTALVDRLEAKRFIVRKPNPKDRRGYFVALSEGAIDRAGLDLLPMAEQIAAVAARRSPADQQVIADFLNEVAATLTKGGRNPRSASRASR